MLQVKNITYALLFVCIYPIHVCAWAWRGRKTYRGIPKSFRCQPGTLPSTGGLRKDPFVIFCLESFIDIQIWFKPLPTFDRLIYIDSRWSQFSTEPCSCLWRSWRFQQNFCGHDHYKLSTPFPGIATEFLTKWSACSCLLCVYTVPQIPQANCLQILSVTFGWRGFSKPWGWQTTHDKFTARLASQTWG